jgi:hypothetical protein
VRGSFHGPRFARREQRDFIGCDSAVREPQRGRRGPRDCAASTLPSARGAHLKASHAIGLSMLPVGPAVDGMTAIS